MSLNYLVKYKRSKIEKKSDIFNRITPVCIYIHKVRKRKVSIRVLLSQIKCLNVVVCHEYTRH